MCECTLYVTVKLSCVLEKKKSSAETGAGWLISRNPTRKSSFSLVAKGGSQNAHTKRDTKRANQIRPWSPSPLQSLRLHGRGQLPLQRRPTSLILGRGRLRLHRLDPRADPGHVSKVARREGRHRVGVHHGLQVLVQLVHPGHACSTRGNPNADHTCRYYVDQQENDTSRNSKATRHGSGALEVAVWAWDFAIFRRCSAGKVRIDRGAV